MAHLAIDAIFDDINLKSKHCTVMNYDQQGTKQTFFWSHIIYIYGQSQMLNPAAHTCTG